MPNLGKPAHDEILGALREFAGTGGVVEDSYRSTIALQRGFSTLKEMDGGGRRRSACVKLPSARRASLIRSLLTWLRSHEHEGWSGCSLVFRLSRTFRAGGRRWNVFSDLFFARKEGLYWNNFLTSADADRRDYRRLEKIAFIGAVTRSLEPMGFRVSYHPPLGMPFDQDFLTSTEILKKAPRLAEWRPPKP